MLQHCDSHFNTAEILAMAELGCQHVTISAPNLRKLMETTDTLPPVVGTKPKHPYAEFVIANRLQTLAALDPLAGPGWDGVLATMDTDFVADGGAKLDRFIEADAVLNKRFGDACKLFLGAEEEAKVAIERLIAARGV
jgi:transaldolase